MTIPQAIRRSRGHHVPLHCGLMGATTLTGGINAIMLNRERQRTEEANQRAEAARQELAEERRRFDERIETLINEQSEERQVMLATIAELTNAIAELRRHNGDGAANGQ